MDTEIIASKVDGAFLKPNDSHDSIGSYFQIAVSKKIRGICVLPHRIRQGRNLINLYGKCFEKPKLILCVNFPWGTSSACVSQTKIGLENTADEIDYLVCTGYVNDNNFLPVMAETMELSRITHDYGKKFKFIIEISLLNEDQTKRLVGIGEKAEVDWIKTSSGIINSRPTTLDDIRLIKSLTSIPIKASAGISTREDAMAMLEVGADILGVGSSLVKVLED